MVARTRLGVLQLLFLGASLARRGFLSAAALVVALVTVIGLAILAIALAAKGGDQPIYDVPLIGSSALAWGAGFLLAVTASMNAFTRDRADGVRQLFVARTASVRAYGIARVGGLAMILALVVGGGTLVAGLVSILGATKVGAVLRTLQSTLASLSFALAFAALIAPLSFVALGARSRVRGYGFLLALLIVPELFAGAVAGILPPQVTELIAIPSALAALRASLAPGTADGWRLVRAAIAIAIFVALAVALVRRDLRERPEVSA